MSIKTKMREFENLLNLTLEQVQKCRFLLALSTLGKAISILIKVVERSLKHGRSKNKSSEPHLWPPDEWTYDRPRTDEEIRILKKDLLKQAQEHGFKLGDTCVGCSRERVCRLAYDAYNTNGDCLWEK